MAFFRAKQPPRGVVVLALSLWLLGAAVAAASPRVPPLESGAVQDVSSAPLSPAERGRLEQALAQSSGPEQYKVLIIDSSAPQRLEEYLDAVWAEWQLPADTILLLVARDQGYSIRFYLGARITGYGVTVDSAVAAIREHYSPRVREGQLVDGLAALAAELHRQVVAGGGRPTVAVPAETGKAATGQLFPWGQFRWRMPDFMDPRLPLWLGAAGVGLVGLALIQYGLARRRWRQGA